MASAPTRSRFTVLTFIKDVAIGLLCWFVLTAAIGEARVVPTGSMEPTILVGDRIWTDKISLRLGSQIQRGDMVVFDPPVLAESQFLKRVIGLPGETVEIRQGRVFIDGTALSEPYLLEPMDYTLAPLTIPAGQYLVLGDNRNVSNDSHRWGLLDGGRIKARAVFRIWPLDRIGGL